VSRLKCALVGESFSLNLAAKQLKFINFNQKVKIIGYMPKSKDTESRILDAARIIFIKKGLAGARMQEIANEAGINKALLHYYFRSKEKLFDKIFVDVFQTISAGIGEALDPQLSVMEQLENLVTVYIKVISKNSFLPVFILNEMNQNPQRLQRVIEQGIFPSLQGFILQFMQEVNLGKIRPVHPSHLLMNVMGMIILPFAAKPVLKPMIKEKMGIDYDDILEERKDAILQFLKDALTIS
jgi:TetR/AcrR family transcriptional regulator